MIKHFLSVLIFLFISFFIFFVISTYISNKNKEKINSNRINVDTKIEENLSSLSTLKNDTSDVIEFNTGYNNDKNKIKRNFWNLFKQND
jgi:hypothetical protein